jgi:hypothetical protein
MNSERGVNVLDPLVREKKALTSKRKKTDEDLAQIARLEWEHALYHDSELGPYIPAQNIEAMLRDGAKLEKRGTDIVRGISVIEPRIKLEYDGPRDLEKLWKAGTYADIRSVKQQKARIMKTRPIFPNWVIVPTIAYDTAVFNEPDIIRIAELAGRYVGLGDFRQRFGRFDVEVLK